MQNLLKHLLTEGDNATYCVVRLSFFFAILVGLGLAVYATIKQIPFDLQSFGVGVATLLSGAGLSIKLKKSDDSS